MRDTLVAMPLTATTPRTRRAQHKRPHITMQHLVVAVLAVTLAGAFIVPGYHHDQVAAPEHYATIKIAASETLWQIARRYPISGYSTVETVEAIRQTNHLTRSDLSQGQLIRVPVNEPSSATLASR